MLQFHACLFTLGPHWFLFNWLKLTSSSKKICSVPIAKWPRWIWRGWFCTNCTNATAANSRSDTARVFNFPRSPCLVVTNAIKSYTFFLADSSELKHAQLPCGPKEVKIFDESLGEFEPRTFEVASKYMYVQVGKGSVRVVLKSVTEMIFFHWK